MRGVLVSMVLLATAATASAQAPSPIDPNLFAFPGAFESPASGISAGVGLADRWLGDEPFSNPAAPPAGHVTASPALLHLSRQDLRAGNRNYDETGAFFDGAGAAISLERVPVWLYFHQPNLRFEDFAFIRGTGTDPSVPPATMRGQADVRETRAGVAGSLRILGVRWGAGVEWTSRDDRYQTQEQSGAPDQGDRMVEFGGSAVGWTAGARYGSPDSGAGHWTVGAAIRSLSKMKVEGEQTFDLLTGTTVTAVTAERESGWEGGASARYALSDAFRLLASAGGRTEQAWDGFGLVSGDMFGWWLGGDFHDVRDPWTLRFGLGQEQQSDVPETRASSLGLGMGWDLDGVLLDVGVLHRSVERAGRPRSYDDRLVGTVTVGF